jgi:hypothetical protein
MVTTSSSGWELERVNNRASNRLPSSAPAATIAFVRFNRTSRFARWGAGAAAERPGRGTLLSRCILSQVRILPVAGLNLQPNYARALDIRKSIPMLAAN